MTYKIFASVVLASVCTFASAQSDSVKTRPVSLQQHFVGVQANQLIRQILNFSEDNSTIDNPFLLTYSTNWGSGLGINVGLGYEFGEISTKDGQIERKTNNDDFSLRVGPEKKFWLGKKWLASAGMDVIIDRQKRETTNTTETDFGKTDITTKSKISGWGVGPRMAISFQVTKSIFLGTEATYYFKKLKNKGEVISSITFKGTDIEGNEIETTESETTETEDKTKQLSFSVPAVLFLILKF